MGEQNFKGKVLVCDMDGTLLDSRGRLSEQNVKAIRRFVNGGGLFTVATGRMIKTVEPYIDVLPLNIPAIVYNGAAIYDFYDKKLLWQNYLQEGIENIIEKILAKYPEIGIEICHDYNFYIANSNIQIEKHIIREDGLLPIYVPISEIPKPWFKVLLAWEPELLLDVEKFLKGMSEPIHTVFSEPQFLEILNKGVSKGNALKKLSSIIQYPCDNIIAMGDNLNDYEMLVTAGKGIAMGNANEALKEVACMCCSHNDQHAVAEVIDMIEKGTICCI